jgi:hypothetical protein
MNLLAALLVTAQVDLRPDPSALPGTAQLQSLVNGLAFWALIACLGAIAIGGGMWAFGGRANNYNAVGNGKTLVAGGAIGAALVGGAAAIVNFFVSVGSGGT